MSNELNQNKSCTCPSGYGSLRWPCPQHPPGSDLARRAPAQQEVADERKPTDLSKRLRDSAAADVSYEMARLLIGAAEEIERYYGGMMAWKRTAGAKDASITQPAGQQAECALLPAELGNAFITLESSGGEGRSIVLKFNQREDAYAVHDFLLKGGGKDYSAPTPDAGQAAAGPAATGWKKIASAGQVKVGDKLRFNIGDEKFNETVKLIIHAGTDGEEIIYNKSRNFYVITSMAIANKGSSKNVEFRRAAMADPVGAAEKGGAA